MAVITNEMIRCTYDVGIRVYRGDLTRQDGKAEVHQRTNMHPGSAGDYINALGCMLDGRVYKRTISLFATEYFLERIGQDYGREQQQKAAQAVCAHVQYYRTVNGYLAGADKLAKRYL